MRRLKPIGGCDASERRKSLLHPMLNGELKSHRSRWPSSANNMTWSSAITACKMSHYENCALLGYYAACGGNSLPMFWDNLEHGICGLGSSVCIATELRAGRSGIESRWGRDFPPVQTDPGAHPASCKTGTGSFPGVKCGWGMLLTTHPLLVPWSWKSRAIPLPTPPGHTGPVTGSLT